MTRNKMVIFPFTFIISFIFLVFCFGNHGLTYQVALKRQVRQLEYQRDELVAKVDSLKQEQENMQSGSGVKDAAFRLGYQMEGEQVYYFQDTEALAPKVTEESPRLELVYFHLPLWALASIALGIALLITLLTIWVGEKRNG